MEDTLRLIAGGLLALICAYAGVMIKRHYAERQKFYAAMCDFYQYASAELSFKKTPLPDVISKFSLGRKGAQVKFLSDYMAALVRADGLDAMMEKIDVPHLKKQEKQELIECMRELGRTSLSEQLAHIGRAAETYKNKESKCKEESRRLGGMYFKLAVLIGIALIIILA